MNCPPLATMADLASLGLLEGRRVRLLEDVGLFVRKGAVGLVTDVRSDCPRATVHYPTDHPWGQSVESPFWKLELLVEDEATK